MLIKTALFTVWAFLGAVFTYGALYAFTPYGLAILSIGLLIAWWLPGHGLRRSPEAWGLLAGPGIFCFVVAGNAEAPEQWAAVGAAFIAVALVAFAVSGRARCARQA